MTVPLHKVLETLLVLEDGAQAAKRDAFEGVVARLNQIEQDLDTFDVKEVKLRTLVAVDSILETIKGGKNESCRVSRLVNLTILHVVLENLDSALATEHLLALTAVFANIRHNVER